MRARVLRGLLALATMVAVMPGIAHAAPLAIVYLSPHHNQITVPPAGIEVKFDQCVVAPPSSSIELRSPHGTLVSGFVSMPNCSTIQLGPTETLASGQYTIFVFGITVGGSSTSMSTVFFVDGVAPVAPNPAITHPINASNRTQVRVTGTGEPGSTVFVTIDDQNGATPAIACGVSGGPPCGVVGAGGLFNIGPFDVTSLDDSPAPGSGVLNTLSIKATVTLTDAAMNVSPPRFAYAFKDTVFPAAPTIVYPANGQTNANSRWTISGTVPHEPGYRHLDVQVRDNGVTAATARAWCISGTCAWSATLQLNAGAHAITARAVDAAGNAGAVSNTRNETVTTNSGPDPVYASIDATPAPVKDDVSVSGVAMTGSTLRFRLNADPEVACAIAAPSGVPNYSCGPFSTAALAGGVHTIRIRDVSTGDQSFTHILRDDEIPALPTIQFSDPDPWVNAAEASAVRLDGNAEPLARVSGSVTSSGGGTPLLFSTNADVFGNWKATTNVSTLFDGALSVCVTSNDARGNTTASSCTGPGPTLDATLPPAPVIITPAEASTVTSTTFPVTGSAAGGAVAVDIFEGTTPRASGSAVAFGGAGINVTLYVDGAKSLRARSIDQAGNVGPFSAPRSFVLDANAPVLFSTTPPNNGVINPSGSLSASYTDPDHAVLGACTMEVRDRGGALAMGSTSISGLFCNFTAAANALSTAGNPYTATVQVADPAANASPPSTWTFFVDAQPPGAPVITQPAQNALLSTPNVQISGTVEPNAQIQIHEGATFHGATIANGSGQWTITLPFGAGSHTITAIPIDVAGNVGPGTNRTFVLDLTAPAAPVISSPAPASTVPPNTPVTGTAESGATVQLFEGATLLGTAVANPSWSITPNPTLGHGTHTVTAYAVDPAGNVSPGTSRTYDVDFLAPNEPIITTPAEGAFLNNPTVTVSGTAEAGTTVRIAEGETPRGSTPATPSWSINLMFTEGQHRISADSVDAVNNVSTKVFRTFTIDTQPPAPPVIIAPVAGSTQPGTLTVQGTGERGATVEIEEGVIIGTTTVASSGLWSIQLSMIDGVHAIRVRGIDPAGNIGGWSPIRSFTVDATPPGAPTINTPLPGSINGASVTVSGTAPEGSGVVTILENGNPKATAGVSASGTWSVIVPFDDGAHSIVARQTDIAGNLGAPSLPRAFSTDGTAPTVSITAPAPLAAALPAHSIATPTITGIADDTSNFTRFSVGLDRVEVRVFSIVDQSTPVSVGNASCTPVCGTDLGRVTWSYSPVSLLPGIYIVQVVAIDKAGNETTPPEERMFVTLGT